MKTMKRTTLAVTALLGTLLLAAPDALAGHKRSRWAFNFGLGGGGGFVQASLGYPHYASRVVVAPVVHVHHRIPIYHRVWVPARYEQVFVGYDRCGYPVYRTVCVSEGYYHSVVAGYRCSICRHRF